MPVEPERYPGYVLGQINPIRGPKIHIKPPHNKQT